MELEEAQRAIAAAKAKADEMGLPMCIAVMNEHAYLIAFVRTGDTTLDSIQLAIDKAYTSALIRMDTRELGRLSQPGEQLYGIQNNLGGKMVIFPGGIPIWRDGRLFGAVGASGGMVDEDEAVALAGVKALST
jgi:corrinoid adenosyltransferase